MDKPHEPTEHAPHADNGKKCGCLTEGRYDGKDVFVCECGAAYDRWEVTRFPGGLFKCYDCGKSVKYNGHNPAWDDDDKITINPAPLMTDHTHINEDGDFDSDLFEDLPPGYLALSFRDPYARDALRLLADKTPNAQLRNDIRTALRNTQSEIKSPTEVDHKH